MSAWERAAAAGRDAVQRGRRSLATGSWVLAALRDVPDPAVPIAAPWEVTLVQLVLRHPRTPPRLDRALKYAERMGAVSLSPESVGFDGESAEWRDVAEVRTRNAFDVLTTDALDREIDRIRGLLPPLPGRKWVVTRVTEVVLTLALATLEQASEKSWDELQVVSDLVERGALGRRRHLQPGLFATLILSLRRTAYDSLLATAGTHDVPIVPDPSSTSEPSDRAALIRRRTDALAARIRRLHDAEPPRDTTPRAELE